MTGRQTWSLSPMYSQICMVFQVQVYDITMMAAIKAQQCGPAKLSITGEWQWLLAQFASAYGIRQSYAVLTHLRWVMRCAPPLPCTCSF